MKIFLRKEKVKEKKSEQPGRQWFGRLTSLPVGFISLFQLGLLICKLFH